MLHKMDTGDPVGNFGITTWPALRGLASKHRQTTHSTSSRSTGSYFPKMTTRRVLVFLFLIGLPCQCVGQDRNGWINGWTMGQIITNFSKESLGTDYFQDILARHDFKFDDVNGENLRKQLSDTLQQSFADSMQAVRGLKEVLEEGYDNGEFDENSHGFSECCEVNTDGMERDPVLMTKVNFDALCYRLSPDTPPGSTLTATPKVRDRMKHNQVTYSSLTWQYFGTENGTMSMYPEHLDTPTTHTPFIFGEDVPENPKCRGYDPRIRPWYVETASPVAKDIVLVLDKSKSMKEEIHLAGGSKVSLMSLAIEAAKNVLGTLNANDRVGLVLFSTNANKPGYGYDPCFYSDLAFAIPENIQYLKSYLDDVIAEGSTDYHKALIEAFEFFKTSPTHDKLPQRRRALLFITDGEPTGTTPALVLKKLYEQMSLVNNSVTVLTYGIASEKMTEAARELLRDMALLPNITLTAAQREQYVYGSFTHIPNPGRLRESLGSYYATFVSPEVDPIFTVPYVDTDGLGLVVSVCLPVYSHSPAAKLRGVTCVDVSMAEIASNVTFFNHGELAYAFLMDTSGRTMMHPLLPSPNQVQEAAVILDIRLLEADLALGEIIESMKRGETGSRHVDDKKLSQSRGNSTKDGVKTFSADVTYFWTKIPETKFSLAVAVPNTDRDMKLKMAVNSRHFVYHRLDLVPPEATRVCLMGDVLVTYEHSSVFLTPLAFKKPFHYMHKTETKNTVGQFALEMERSSDVESDIFRDNVRELVALTEPMEEFWLADRDYAPYIIERYIGTVAGSIRVYPGIVLPRNYDHTKRRWYEIALANRGRHVLTPPYEDAFGGGRILTLAYAVDIVDESGERHLVGVMGADIQSSYIGYLTQEAFPACRDPEHTCFLVDSNGFILYHEDIENDASGVDFDDAHITQLEPDIADDLIKKELMKAHSCVNFGVKNIYRTWQLTSPERNWDAIPSYDMEIAHNSNVSVIIKRKGGVPNTYCSGHDKVAEIPECEQTEGCFVPCRSVANFDYCHNKFEITSDDDVPCVPQEPTANFNLDVNEETEHKPVACPNRTCHLSRVPRQCQAMIGCAWCEFPDGEEYCTGVEDCNSPTTTESDGFPNEAIIGISVAAALVIAALAVGLGLFCKRRGLCPGNGSSPAMMLFPDVSISNGGSISNITSDTDTTDGDHYQRPDSDVPAMPPPVALPRPYIVSSRGVLWYRLDDENQRERVRDC